MTLLQTAVSEMGRYFAGALLSPFLKIGVASAVFQSSGTIPWDREAEKISVKADAISNAASFRNFV